MIRVNCDMCGDLINYEINGVDVTFNSYGVVNFNKARHAEYQLCKTCAGKVAEMIESAYEKLEKPDGIEKRLKYDGGKDE